MCKKQDIFFRILRLRAFQIKGMVDAKSVISCFVLLYVLFMGLFIKQLKQQSRIIYEENYFINCFEVRKLPFLLHKYCYTCNAFPCRRVGSVCTSHKKRLLNLGNYCSFVR